MATEEETMKSFLGDWELDTSDKFDDLMKVYEVSWLTRQAANKLVPRVTFKKLDDGSYEWCSSTRLKSTKFTFKLNEECTEKTADDAEVKTKVELAGKILKQVQEHEKRARTEITREIKDDKLHMILKASDVVCTRIYKKVNA